MAAASGTAGYYAYVASPNAVENRENAAAAINDLISDQGAYVTPATDVPGSIVLQDPVSYANQVQVTGTPLDSADMPTIPPPSQPAGITTQSLVTPLPEQQLGGNVYSYTSQLDRNMQQAGLVRPTNTAAHHIIAQNDPRALVARGILAAAGIGINDATNGVYLPADQNAPNPTGANVHSTLHTFRYYQEVTARLIFRGNQSVPGVLQQINQELQNGTFPH